ncbi:hypothetical protein DMA11_13785 [Marinilabiliaceae bacterium JC017]|nr:hypothetical protein DMA11_13785 [Marinilabiliaceae bacterium JC017]
MRKKEINVTFNVIVKLIGDYISLIHCEITKGKDTIAWSMNLRNDNIIVSKQGDNYGWLTTSLTPFGRETITAIIGGFIKATGTESLSV